MGINQKEFLIYREEETPEEVTVLKSPSSLALMALALSIPPRSDLPKLIIVAKTGFIPKEEGGSGAEQRWSSC